MSDLEHKLQPWHARQHTEKFERGANAPQFHQKRALDEFVSSRTVDGLEPGYWVNADGTIEFNRQRREQKRETLPVERPGLVRCVCGSSDWVRGGKCWSCRRADDSLLAAA